MSQPPYPGQPQPSDRYGYRPASGRPAGRGERPVPGAEHAPAGSSGYGRVPTGHCGPQAAYGQAPVEYGGAAAPASAPAGSSNPPPGGAPIPVTQESVVIRASATGSSRLIMLVTGGFGLVALAGAVHDFVDAKIGSGIILIIVGSLALAMVTLFMTMRTTLDAGGIHTSSLLGTRDHPWPASRRSFHVRTTSAGLVDLVEGAEGGIGCLIGVVMVLAVFLIIKRAKIVMATPEGRAVRLTGPTRVGVSRRRLEARGAADLDRIWAWAVARGYTRETGEQTASASGLRGAGILGLDAHGASPRRPQPPIRRSASH